MNVAYVRLLSSHHEALWRGPGTSADELRRLRRRRGENIVAVDPESQQLLGWISLYPDRDAGGTYYSLASLEVLPDHRRKGIGTGLVGEAGRYMRERRGKRLKFGTSPLLTWNAGLCIKGFGMRYAWKEGVRTAEGKPWPYVSCEWELEDPLVKPLELREEDLPERSAVEWKGAIPAAKPGLVYSGPLYLPLPDISNDELADRVAQNPNFLFAAYAVFHELYRHGYRFGWFDTMSPRRIPGCRCFYFMENPFTL